MELRLITPKISMINENEDGYSLLELIITIFIMGMILLVVNVVLVSTIRVSQEADARMKIRQGIESGLEIIRRDIKSGNSDSVEVIDDGGVEKLKVSLPETGNTVYFYLDEIDDIGAIKADWGDGRIVNITSTKDLSVTSFGIEVANDYSSGTAQIILTIQADSLSSGKDSTPVIEGFLKQATIVTEGQDV